MPPYWPISGPAGPPGPAGPHGTNASTIMGTGFGTQVGIGSSMNFSLAGAGGATIMPYNGTLDLLAVAVALAGSDGAVTCTIVKNGVDTALSASALHGAGTPHDYTHVVTVAQGDLVEMKVSNTSTTVPTGDLNDWTMRYTAT